MSVSTPQIISVSSHIMQNSTCRRQLEIIRMNYWLVSEGFPWKPFGCRCLTLDQNVDVTLKWLAIRLSYLRRKKPNLMLRGFVLELTIEQQIEKKKTWSPYHPYEVSSLLHCSVYFYAYETNLTSLGYLNRIKALTNLYSLSPSPVFYRKL